MKKIFTLALALLGFAGAANAATVDDVAVCKHSYVLVCDDYTNNGTGSRTKGGLFANGFFLDVTGGSVATNKGKVNLAEADGVLVTDEIAAKYGEYGEHLNSLRLKNDQDVIAMKVTAKSKIIIFYQNNGADRYPMFGLDSKPTTNPMEVQGEKTETVNKCARMEWTAPDDMTIYIGGKGGDQFLSFIIVEANEAPGTPTVKVGDQKFEGGLWFREVTCKANPATEEGSDEQIPTIVTYTTDGTTPTAASPIYKEPIKCYKDMTVKFQAFLDFGDSTPTADFICEGADNEGIVNFAFDAPTIEANGAAFTIVSPYAEQNGTNFFTLAADGQAVEGNGTTLDQSATVTAYTIIKNGEYGEFKSKSTTKDVYVLNPIKEKKTIAIASADVVVDEEATAASTDGSTIYKVENGTLTTDKKDFFVKNLTFAVLKDAKAQYQVPEGQEAYIQMSNTNIVFQVAEGDSVVVKVVCSKNSCKNIDADDAEDGSQVNDRKCYVNVSGTNYCLKDAEGNETNDLKLYPNANVFEFGLGAGTYTFQKYSGTGNILISSIEITPAAAAPAAEPWAAPETERAVNKTYDLAGTWAGDWFEPGQNYDASEYDYVWIKYSGYTGKINFGITYMEWESTQSWGEVYHSDAVTLNEAAGIAAVKLEKTKTIVNGINNVESEYKGDIYAKHVKNVFLQDQGTASKITVEGIYFGTEAAYNAAVATGIQGVKTVNAQNGAVFNLAGQRVDANYKGVVIMRGKKMILK